MKNKVKLNYLKELGFVEFVAINKEKRDDKIRLVWSQILENCIITFRIVSENNNWHVDYYSPKNDCLQYNILVKYFGNVFEFDLILEIIEKLTFSAFYDKNPNGP